MYRIDMLDELAARAFGIANPGAYYDNNNDAYKWRWLCDELVQAMSDEQARDIIEFIARMHDINLTDADND